MSKTSRNHHVGDVWKGQKWEDRTHYCSGALPESLYGPAISDCVETPKGEMWVGNDEYTSRVNFCPYCGQKARAQVGTKNKE